MNKKTFQFAQPDPNIAFPTADCVERLVSANLRGNWKVTEIQPQECSGCEGCIYTVPLKVGEYEKYCAKCPRNPTYVDHYQPKQVCDKKIETIECPFCKEDDFDDIGLKIHIGSGYCEVYNSLKLNIESKPQAKPVDLSAIEIGDEVQSNLFGDTKFTVTEVYDNSIVSGTIYIDKKHITAHRPKDRLKGRTLCGTLDLINKPKE